MGNFLHVKELKKYFNDYTSIGINDFYIFYKIFNPKIKKNSVQAYIFQLKEKGVIEHVSRGRYRLSNRENINAEYMSMVIIMDVVDSSKYNNFDEEFSRKIQKINKYLSNPKELNINNNITRCDLNKSYNLYHIYKGDEIQIVYPFIKNFGDLLIFTLSMLYPFKLRYSISIGYIDSIKKNPWEMNGPIFWNARDALESLSSNKTYNGVITIGDNLKDNIINGITPLIDKSLNKVSEKQWESIRYTFIENDLNAILKELNLLSKSSYYERIDTSNINEIKNIFKAIYKIVRLEIRYV